MVSVAASLRATVATTMAINSFAFCIAQSKQRRQEQFSDLHPTTALTRAPVVDSLCLNLGLYCNQACSHCHVEASPRRRKEMMSRRTAARCLRLLQDEPGVRTVDLTGT